VGAHEIFSRSIEVAIVNTHLTYLLVDASCLLVPFVCSFHPAIRFHREWKFVALPALFTATFFLIWDAIFTAHGVWGFNPNYVLGIYVYNLPLEEVLFFFCIPYACVFTYFCMRQLVPSLLNRNFSVASVLIGLALIVAAVVNYERAYTFSALGLCGLLILVVWISMRELLALFFVSYLLVMPFFLLSNGILTGTFLESPVVWFDNTESWNQAADYSC